MKPYYQDDSTTIYLGDCRSILPELQGVNLVVTDPPYELDGRPPGKSQYVNDLSKFEGDEYLRLTDGFDHEWIFSWIRDCSYFLICFVFARTSKSRSS